MLIADIKFFDNIPSVENSVVAGIDIGWYLLSYSSLFKPYGMFIFG